MLFCKRCLYAESHPLGLILDEEGICSGCRIHEEKDALDWDERWQKLVELLKPYKDKSGSQYDCIIPVSGGQDSYYMVHLVKKRLGLNPLLVTYNKYFNTPLGVRNLANLRIRFNCDILYQNINPISVKKITRSTLRQFGSIYWPILAGHTVFPVQTAVRYKIPLILWGAHQGLEQVGMFSHTHEVEMTRRYRKDHDLMGYEADDLLSIFDTLTEEDIWQYRYPEDRDLHDVGVRGVYLGNYVRWDPKAQHEQMMREYGYQTSAFPRTFDCYDYVDCFNYMDIHDVLKLYKHGYSKVTDHACREIRFGRMSREQGLIWVQRYEQQPLQYLDLFQDWLGVTSQAFDFIINQFRNPLFWDQYEINRWSFNGLSQQQSGRDELPYCLPIQGPVEWFVANKSMLLNNEQKYIIVGKGWP
ncbi:MAG: N-acetyl sugar amidotransferase [Zetaproteobacteria bacterium]|nr:N-acetyl sugar amidotransferase [Zetaproteobacteria bacterium]